MWWGLKVFTQSATAIVDVLNRRSKPVLCEFRYTPPVYKYEILPVKIIETEKKND